MELNQLNTIVKVVQTDSFTRAAERLRSQKAHVSRAVGILGAADDARRAVQQGQGEARGTLRLTCGVAFGMLAQGEVDLGNLQPVMVNRTLPSAPVYAVFASARYLTPKVKAFIDLAALAFASIMVEPSQSSERVAA